MKIKKAVIPAAGFGTRVLPATKAQPKEMLSIVDKPALQYLVEELVESGITEVLIITGRNKSSIENHFDYSYELEKILEENNKIDLLNKVKSISNMINIYYIRQKVPLGLGDAISYAEPFIGNEPFLVLLGDDIMYTTENEKPVSLQMIEKYEQTKGGNILGVQKIPKDMVNKYGIVSPYDKIDEDTYLVDKFIEKPNIDEAPSNYAALGRYILDPNIFKYIKNTVPGKNNEIQLTDAIMMMSNDGIPLYSYNFKGIRYDVGDKIGLLKANVEFGLRHEELKEEFTDFIKKIGIKL